MSAQEWHAEFVSKTRWSPSKQPFGRSNKVHVTDLSYIRVAASLLRLRSLSKCKTNQKSAQRDNQKSVAKGRIKSDFAVIPCYGAARSRECIREIVTEQAKAAVNRPKLPLPNTSSEIYGYASDKHRSHTSPSLPHIWIGEIFRRTASGLSPAIRQQFIGAFRRMAGDFVVQIKEEVIEFGTKRHYHRIRGFSHTATRSAGRSSL
jgi:hypothetical protein